MNTRQIIGIHRDSTEPQLLHLPLSYRPHAHPLTILAIYAASGLITFAVIALIVSL